MRYALFLWLVFCFTDGTAQQADFIVLKKKDKTIQSYYAGTPIEFTTVHGQYKKATITAVANDSIFLQEFFVRTYTTQMGYYVTDTMGSVRSALPYRDIKYFGRPRKGFDWQASGYGLLGGGILLTVASAVVFLVDRDKFSPELLIASAGLGTIGYFLSKAAGKGIVIGKNNYHLEYIKLTP